MKSTIETLSPVSRKLTVTIPNDRVLKELNNAYRNLQREIHMKGFRPGKVPRAVLEARFKPQVESEVTGKLISDTFEVIVGEHKLDLVSQPTIEPGKLRKNSDFEYVATLEIRPEVEAKGYLDLELTRDKIEVTESLVDSQLQLLREQRTSLTEVEEDRPLRDGDIARIDYTMEVDGKVLDNKGEPRNIHVAVKLEDDRFLPGFSANVVGMNVGETRSFELSMPENFSQPNLAGKHPRLTVTLCDIKRQEMPEVDDEFAKDLEFDSLDALREKVRSDIEAQMKSAAEVKMHRQIGEALVAKNLIELPPGLVSQEVDMLAREQYRRSGRQAPKGRLQLSEEVRSALSEEAEYRIKASLILDSVAKQEKIEVTEADVEERLAEIAKESNQHVEAVRGYYVKNNAMEQVRASIVEEKAYKFVIDRAKISVAGEPPAKGTSEENQHAEEIQVEEPQVEETPTEVAPLEEPQVAETPVEETPIEVPQLEESPAEETPVEEP